MMHIFNCLHYLVFVTITQLFGSWLFFCHEAMEKLENARFERCKVMEKVKYLSRR